MADATKDDHYSKSENLAPATVIVLVTLSISLYNAAELFLLIFITFAHRKGLYFWSLLISTFSVIIYSLGYMINFFELSHSCAGIVINNIGWILMLMSQSFVLYSRLHLVLDDKRILRLVLAMIIVDSIIFFIPTSVLTYVANYSDNPLPAAEGYRVYEKIQMTGFCLQEFILSGLYIWKAVELLKLVLKEDARRMMWQLFSVNVVIVIMDLALLGIEYRNLRIYEQTAKGVVYSVKLKMEYAILGKLVQLVTNDRSASFGTTRGDRKGGIADFVDVTKSSVDITRGNSAEVTQQEHLEYGGKCNTSSSDSASGSPRTEEVVKSWSSSMMSENQMEAGDLYATAVRQISAKH